MPAIIINHFIAYQARVFRIKDINKAKFLTEKKIENPIRGFRRVRETISIIQMAKRKWKRLLNRAQFSTLNVFFPFQSCARVVNSQRRRRFIFHSHFRCFYSFTSVVCWLGPGGINTSTSRFYIRGARARYIVSLCFIIYEISLILALLASAAACRVYFLRVMSLRSFRAFVFI